MPSHRTIKTSNDSYLTRSRNRRRKRGPMDAVALAQNIPAGALEPRAARKYRYADLQGTERIEMLRIARDCAMAAMTNFEMAQYFGVSERTLNEWVLKDPEFAIAMRLNRQLADERVEKALYSRALGYRFHAEEIKITEDGTVHRVDVVKQVPPDVGAAIFWLKNRMPHLWKDKIDVDANVSGQVDVSVKADDPRQLAMAVLDIVQQAVYAKIPPTIDGETVSKRRLAEYTDAELEKLDNEELDRLMREDDE